LSDRALSCALIAIACGCIASCGESPPPPVEDNFGEPLAVEWSADDLFDKDRVLDIRITIDPADWDILRVQTRSVFDLLGKDCFQGPPKKVFTWFEADVTIDGIAMERIAVRKKGFQGSLDRHRPALKLDFNRHLSEQSFGGLTRMTLNNVKADPTKIRTCLANQFFSLAGVPASRCNFATVEVNGVRLGLYAHVEPIKKPFLREHFSDDEGNLYEGLMSDFEPQWTATFEKKTNEGEADWSDVEAAAAALALEDDSFLEAAAEQFDLDAFYTFWAMEILLGQKDGYADSLNNYHVYRDPESDRFHFIPWAPDTAFSNLFNPSENKPHSVTAHGRLAYRLYLHPPSREVYLARLKELVEELWDVDTLQQALDAMVAVITPHLTQAEIDAMNAELPSIRSYLEVKGANVLEELENETPEWSHTWSNPPCWEPIGEISGSFATQWNTLGNPSPLEIGWSEMEGNTHGTPLEPFGGSAVAGMGTGEVQQTVGRVEVRVLTPLMNGLGIGLILSINPEDFVSGVSLETDHASAAGYWIEIKGGDSSSEFGGFFTNGVIELETIEMTNGGYIGGQFSGELHLPPTDW
jgi:spore coat protein CotH